MRNAILFLAIAGSLNAQTPAAPADQPPPGSISGQVFYAASNAPIPYADVSVRAGGKSVTAKADDHGRYLLKGVTPGGVNVTASEPQVQQGFPSQATRRVQLAPGQELTSFDFKIVMPPQIRGRVIDENKEPVPDAQVMVVSREYSHGALRYVFSGSGRTDDQGNYTVSRMEPGRAYILMTRRQIPQADAVSDLPTDPAMRKRASGSTYYPGTTAIEAAQLLTLRDGEIREGVDIPLVRGPSLCIEGHVLAGGSAGIMNVGIAPERPTYGQSGNGGMYGRDPWYGKTSADGAIRACGLTPGTYTITVEQWSPANDYLYFGTAIATLTDSDLHEVVVSARPRLPVPIEVLLDGPPPAAPVAGGAAGPTINVGLESLTHAQHTADMGRTPIPVPGTGLIESALVDDYSATTRGLRSGMYVKDISYGGASVMRSVVRVGNAPADATLRVVIGQNGGSIQAKATDKDNNPAGDASVTIFPADAITEADIAVTYVTGRTNQAGMWTTPTLAPGKYYVVATANAPDRSPEFIGKLVGVRGKVDPVELGPGASVSATAVVRSLE